MPSDSNKTRRYSVRYKGTDPQSEWHPGIPARDISADEIDELRGDVPNIDETLGVSRLYEKVAIGAVEDDRPVAFPEPPDAAHTVTGQPAVVVLADDDAGKE